MFKQFKGDGHFAAACEALLDIEPEDQVSIIAINTLMGWLDAGLVKGLNTAAKSNPKLTNPETTGLKTIRLKTVNA